MIKKFKWSPLILAGGKGTRLGNLTKKVPKPMLKVNDRFFIEYILDIFLKMNLESINISVGFNANYFFDYLGESYKGIKINYIVEKKELGTGGAIKKCFSVNHYENLLVMNGDTYCEFDLARFVSAFENRNIQMLLCKKPSDERYGNVLINDNNEIISFYEKSETQSQYINAGVYLIRKSNFKFKKNQFSIENDFFPSYKEKFYGFKTNGKFIDIGTPNSLKMAPKFFQSIKLL